MSEKKPEMLHAWSEGNRTYRIVHNRAEHDKHEACILERSNGRSAMGEEQWVELARAKCGFYALRDRAVKPVTAEEDAEEETLSRTLLIELAHVMVEAKRNGGAPDSSS